MQDRDDLWQRYKHGGEDSARQALIEHHLPLVRYVLGRMSVSPPAHMEQEDLAAAGIIGLIKAVREFDPSRQIRFATFAVPRIRGAILDELRAQNWVPRSARRKAADIQEVYDALRGRHGLSPSIDDVARVMRLPAGQVQKMLWHVETAIFSSLDSPQQAQGDGAQERLSDSLGDPKNELPETNVALEEQEELLTEAIMELPHQHRLVVTLYYFKGLMLKEIAKVLEVSKPRVSQIHNRAMLMLRQRLSSDAPRGLSRAHPAGREKSKPRLSIHRLFEKALLVAKSKPR